MISKFGNYDQSDIEEIAPGKSERYIPAGIGSLWLVLSLGFLIMFDYFQAPLILSAVAAISLFFSFIYLIHNILELMIPHWHRRVDRVLGVVLALSLIVAGLVGIRAERARLNVQNGEGASRVSLAESIDEYSLDAYRVAQLFLLNNNLDREPNVNQITLIASQDSTPTRSSLPSADPAEPEKQDTNAAGATPQEKSKTSNAVAGKAEAGRESESEPKLESKPVLKHQKVNYGLIIARFLAVFLFLFLAYQVIRNFFRDTVERILLAIYAIFGRRPILIIGLGYMGLQLVAQYRRAGHRVIAIEANPQNPNIELARVLGAIVIESNAISFELIRDIPFDGVADIYVVAGCDQTNVRLAMLMKQIADRPEEMSWGIISRVKRWLQKDVSSTCYVRLYDPELHLVLKRAFKTRENKDRNSRLKRCTIDLRTFNSDEYSARTLVQRQLAKSAIRPCDINEVGTYMVVGFDAMGQEMALAIARLAHFENGKRSRILVLDRSHNMEKARSFLVRYPKFTHSESNRIKSRSDEISFDPKFDDWGYASPKSGNIEPEPTGIEFATQSSFVPFPMTPNDPQFIAAVCRLMKPDSRSKEVAKPAVIVCLEDEGEAFTWAHSFRQAYSEYCYRQGYYDEYWNDHRFPILPIFVWLPYQESLQSISGEQYTTDDRFTQFRPFGDIKQSASVRAIRDKVRHENSKVSQISYNWAQSVIRQMNQHQTPAERDGQQPEENAVPPQVAGLIDYPQTLTEDVESQFEQTNLHAVDHALIKWFVATNSTNFVFKDDPVPTESLQIPQEQFDIPQRVTIVNPIKQMNSKQLSPKHETGDNETSEVAPIQTKADQHSVLSDQGNSTGNESLIDKLAMMEHNRWSAEMMLRNYHYVPVEEKRTYLVEKKPKVNRTPAASFTRHTLVSWDDPRLNKGEKLKDQLQAYCTLYYLSQAVD
jgi:hypothetical protein